MRGKAGIDRRKFLKHAAVAIGGVAQSGGWAASGETEDGRFVDHESGGSHASQPDLQYPRRFHESQLRMISFPLGGVAAGSLGLGGRGQLDNWEIFNRPNKGYRPAYAFPSIWAQAGNAKPIARVLEARLQPPFGGPDGLGSSNVPGLGRFKAATFTGQYPLAHIDFEDRAVPVKVELDAFSPFIPHAPDDSGLPVAIMRYKVTDSGPSEVKVGIAYSIDNPVVGTGASPSIAAQRRNDGRRNEFRNLDGLIGVEMSNPGLAQDHAMAGEFVLA